MKRWMVYLLRCGDGSYYAGSTNDLARRLAEHRAGFGCRYTRSRLPVSLAWSLPCRDRSGAQQREAVLKSCSREAKRTLIAAGPDRREWNRLWRRRSGRMG